MFFFIMNNLKLTVRLVPRLNTIRLFSSRKEWREISLPVPWGEIRGKWWGPTNIRPVLTLHGWLDNCGTFNRLIPLLDKNISFLAIDLPGHGYSSHLPPGIRYDYSIFLQAIKYIKKNLNLSKLYLLGHSLGGAVCSGYTVIYPDDVDFLICFDAVKPYVVPGSLQLLAELINEFIKNNDYLMNNKEPTYYTLEEINNRMREALDGSIDANSVYHIVERGVYPSKFYPDKYCFSRDIRLRPNMMEAVKAELIPGLENIKCPVFVMKARNSPYYGSKKTFHEVLEAMKKNSADLHFHYVNGTHHTHLNNPEDELVQVLSIFLRKHFKADEIVVRDDLFLD